jgi:hypothetical protein
MEFHWSYWSSPLMHLSALQFSVLNLTEHILWISCVCSNFDYKMLTAVKIGHCYGSHFKWIHMKFN